MVFVLLPLRYDVIRAGEMTSPEVEVTIPADWLQSPGQRLDLVLSSPVSSTTPTTTPSTTTTTTTTEAPQEDGTNLYILPGICVNLSLSFTPIRSCKPESRWVWRVLRLSCSLYLLSWKYKYCNFIWISEFPVSKRFMLMIGLSWSSFRYCVTRVTGWRANILFTVGNWFTENGCSVR